MDLLLKALSKDIIQMSDDQIYQIAQENGFDICSQEYRVLLVSYRQGISTPEVFQQYCVEMPYYCRVFFNKRRIRSGTGIDTPGRCMILLMERTSRKETEKLIGELIAYLRKHGFPKCFLAAGKCVQSVQDIAQSYQEATNVLGYHSLSTEEEYLFCEDMQSVLQLETLQSMVDPEQMLQAFRDDDIQRLRMMVTDYAEKVRAISGDSIEGRHPTSIRRMFIELTVYVLHIASDMGVDVDAILKGLDPYNFLLANDKSTPTIIDWFIGMCSDLRDAIDEKTRSKEQSIIHQVCEYIDQHITRYDLSLEDAAASVNMTASYLSKVFHREMGIGFSKFIVRRRLKIATKLLKETKLSIKEISALSGFASANYFGAVFKREVGVSPLSYRLQHEKAESS